MPARFCHAANPDVTAELPAPGFGVYIGVVVRAACLLPLVLLVAACGGEGPTPLPNDQVRAGFPAGGVANQIEVSAIDRLPLRGAELVAPDGHATPALSVAANPAPTETFSQQYPGGNYSGPNFGVSSIGSNALAPGVVGAAPTTESKLLAVVSNASIQLPDPVAYRRDWQNYRIRLRFGDPPQAETREIAAPAPPPPAT
jgi:hypothetical protein